MKLFIVILAFIYGIFLKKSTAMLTKQMEHPLMFLSRINGPHIYSPRIGKTFFSTRSSSFLQPKVSIQEFSELTRRTQALALLVDQTEKAFLDLSTSISNIKRRCPEAATEAKVIGDLCFSLETLPQTYPQAKLKCFQKGGMLATPLTSDEDFYSRLIAALPDETTTVSGSEIYVQIVAEGTNFVYESNGISIPLTDSRWNIVPAVPAANDAAALKPTGNSWKLSEVASSNTESRPFLCQYDTFYFQIE